MARQRTTPATPAPRTIPDPYAGGPLPPHVVQFFTRYAELLMLARRMVPLAASMRQDIAGLDPESHLHYSMDFNVGELDRMLTGIDWTTDQIAIVLHSNAANPTHVLAGDYRENPENTPERAFAYDLMERKAYAELGIAKTKDAPPA